MTKIAWQWCWPDLKAHLLVAQDVANLLVGHRQRDCDKECGGQLFVDATNPIGLVLTLATPPHKNDRAGATWLELDANRCREEILWANARGYRLVGYWHTHPQNIPMLSSADIKSFARFAKQYRQHLPHPLAIIVGNSPSPDGIKAWSFRNKTYVEAVWDSWPN